MAHTPDLGHTGHNEMQVIGDNTVEQCGIKYAINQRQITIKAVNPDSTSGQTQRRVLAHVE